MAYETLILEQEEGIAIVTLNLIIPCSLLQGQARSFL